MNWQGGEQLQKKGLSSFRQYAATAGPGSSKIIPACLFRKADARIEAARKRGPRCLLNQNTEAPGVIETYVTAAARHDIPDNGILCLRLLGRPVLLADVNGQVYAMHNLCSHAHGSFERGRLRGHIIICPHHGARFDVRDGRCVGGPADQPIDHYPSRVREGMIEVCLPGEPSHAG